MRTGIASYWPVRPKFGSPAHPGRKDGFFENDNHYLEQTKTAYPNFAKRYFFIRIFSYQQLPIDIGKLLNFVMFYQWLENLTAAPKRRVDGKPVFGLRTTASRAPIRAEQFSRPPVRFVKHNVFDSVQFQLHFDQHVHEATRSGDQSAASKTLSPDWTIFAIPFTTIKINNNFCNKHASEHCHNEYKLCAVGFRKQLLTIF